MTIKQTMSTAIQSDPSNVKAVVNEANDGIKAVPVELVTKASNDSTFTQVSATNGLPVTLTGSNVLDVTFHDAATVAADGSTFSVSGYKTLTVEISGTSTSRTVDFKGLGPSGTAYSIAGVKLSDLSTASSTTGTGELWQFDITGLTSVIMDISAVAGGNVSVKGKAVA